MAETVIKKLDEQLNCSICLDTYHPRLPTGYQILDFSEVIPDMKC